LGRTTVLPASDAPTAQSGDVTLAYYDNDLARSITQAGTTTNFTLDAVDRRSVETVANAEGTVRSIQRHYTDSSDKPTWTTTTEGAVTTVQRFVGGELSMTVTGQGEAEVTLANPHGDIVTTVPLPSTPTAPASSIEGWNSYDEYGNRLLKSVDLGSVDYGRNGAAQRATGGASLILMGARLYNPATGLFTSMDPVVGGNANGYTYPADPTNAYDLDGRQTIRGNKGRAWLYVQKEHSRWWIYIGFRLRVVYFFVWANIDIVYYSKGAAGAYRFSFPSSPRHGFSAKLLLPRRVRKPPPVAFAEIVAFGYRVSWWGTTPMVFFSGFLWDVGR
jgi:RHS repeat-associated protein